MNVIIPLGAGLIISVCGYMYQRKNLGKWLEERRIDNLPEKEKNICGVCGSKMDVRVYRGKEVLRCKRYPECRKIEWNPDL